MSTGEELEFKLRLADARAVERLRELLLQEGEPWPEAVLQRNHFLDTSARVMRASQLTLRVREEGERWFLTAKGPVRESSAGGIAVTRHEEEMPLEEDVAHALLRGDADPVALLRAAIAPRSSPLLDRVQEQVEGERLASIGSFENQRTRLAPRPLEADGLALSFEFDRTSFPGERVDFEVEVELAGPDAETVASAERSLRELFVRAGLPWETNSSKVQRFFGCVGSPDATPPPPPHPTDNAT